jgi:hypothetical protein
VAPLLRRHGLTSEIAPIRPAGRTESEPGAVAGAVPGSIGLHRSVAARRGQAAADSVPHDAPDQLSLL